MSLNIRYRDEIITRRILAYLNPPKIKGMNFDKGKVIFEFDEEYRSYILVRVLSLRMADEKTADFQKIGS